MFELFPERYVKRADSHAMEGTESLVVICIVFLC